MDIEKLIEDLRVLIKQYGEKIPYGELVGAPWPYSRAGDLVWQDPEPYFIEQAANAITDLFGKVEQLQKENAELLARADTADRQRDAAIKELDDVAAAVDDLSDFIDEQIFPIVQYDIYTSLRDNADSISVWNHEKEWRGTKEE